MHAVPELVQIIIEISASLPNQPNAALIGMFVGEYIPTLNWTPDEPVEESVPKESSLKGFVERVKGVLGVRGEYEKMDDSLSDTDARCSTG